MFTVQCPNKTIRISRPSYIEEGSTLPIGLFVQVSEGSEIEDLHPRVYALRESDVGKAREAAITDAQSLQRVPMDNFWRQDDLGLFYKGDDLQTESFSEGSYIVTIEGVRETEITLPFQIISSASIRKEMGAESLESMIELLREDSIDGPVSHVGHLIEKAAEETRDWIESYGTACDFSAAAEFPVPEVAHLEIPMQPFGALVESLLQLGVRSLSYAGDISVSCSPVDEAVIAEGPLTMTLTLKSPIEDGFRPPTLDDRTFFAPVRCQFSQQSAHEAKISWVIDSNFLR